MCFIIVYTDDGKVWGKLKGYTLHLQRELPFSFRVCCIVSVSNDFTYLLVSSVKIVAVLAGNF